MNKLSIISTDLLKAIQLVAPVVREKNVIKIFDNLLVEIIGTKLKVTAANPEIRASVFIDEVNASADFSFCIEKNILLTILNGLPLGTATELEFGNNEIIVSSKIGVYNLPTVPSNEYPKQAEIEDGNSFMVDSGFLLDGLRKAPLFVGDEALAMNGILIRSIENTLYVVGCSNAFFYETQFPYNGNAVDLVLSPSAARYIHQSFDSDDSLTINYNNQLFCVAFGNFSVQVTQMNIKFPDYKKIMNAVKKTMCFRIEKEILLASVKRFQSISDKDNNTLILDIKSNTMELYFENTFKSYKACESLECLSDVNIKIGFNVNYLKAVLSTLESDIEWYFHEVKHPTMFVEENTNILLMAVKFQDNTKKEE